MRSLSEMRLPDVDVPDSVSKIDWPKIDLSSVDVGKAWPVLPQPHTSVVALGDPAGRSPSAG